LIVIEIGSLCDRLVEGTTDVTNVSDDAPDIVATESGTSRRLAVEWFSRNEKRILSELRRRRHHDVERGVPPKFDVEINGARTYIVSRQVETTDGATVSHGIIHGLQSALDGLNSDEFEALGAFLIDAYSGSATGQNAFRTRAGYDGGFDFAGWWFAATADRLLGEFNCRIAGQAKQWSSRVPPDEIIAFSHKLDDLRRDNIRPAGFPSRWLTAESPVLGLYIARSGFRRSCWRHSRPAWIVLLDSQQIAADLVRLGLFKNSDSTRRIADRLEVYTGHQDRSHRSG
jgi:hypothetical protein